MGLLMLRIITAAISYLIEPIWRMARKSSSSTHTQMKMAGNVHFDTEIYTGTQ